MNINGNNNHSPQSSLPPGFRFHPTDEELILHYLVKRVSSTPFPNSIIAEVDIYKFDPWDLPGKAVFGEKEWYFFSPRDRKYPNGVRPNRAAASGYWKATGTDKIIAAPSSGDGGGGGGHHHHPNIGVKKALVFYQGRPPRGLKTNWIMHEYRLAQPPTPSIHNHKPPIRLRDSSMRLDDWVLCRIYKKSNAGAAMAAGIDDEDVQEQEDSLMGDSLRTHHNNNQNAIVQPPPPPPQPQNKPPPPPQNKPPPSFFPNMLDVMMDSSVFGHHLFPDATAAFELSTPTAEYGSLGQSNTDTLPIIAENQLLKRQHWSMMDVAGDVQLPWPPSKRHALSSSSTLTPTNPNQSDCFNNNNYNNNNQSSLFNQSLYFNHNYQ